MKFPKVPRLKDFAYKGANIYFVTIRTAYNRPVFSQADPVRRVHGTLVDCSEKKGFKIWAYCYMPDHLHLLIEGQDQASLKDLMRLFKQRTSYDYKQETDDCLWQPSYYDHVLRNDESFIRVGRYIIDNPVRAKLVKDFQDYPYIGSETLNLKDFLGVEPFDMR